MSELFLLINMMLFVNMVNLPDFFQYFLDFPVHSDLLDPLGHPEIPDLPDHQDHYLGPPRQNLDFVLVRCFIDT